MKTQASSQRLSLIGDGEESELDIAQRMRPRSRKKLGVCAFLVAVSLSAAFAETGFHPARERESGMSATGRLARLSNHLDQSTPLKPPNGFHSPGNAISSVAIGGNDDCPGKPIPAGNYTAVAPYIDSGDTTGANNTISFVFFDYWDNYDTRGPDRVYSFTITSMGTNPEIMLTSPSSAGKLNFYILDHRFDGCPVGTGNLVYHVSAWQDAGLGNILNGNEIRSLPLNVPLYLVVDSDPFYGGGPYTLRIQDVTITQSNANPIDSQLFFVRQQYLDFLNREPDGDGSLTGCLS